MNGNNLVFDNDVGKYQYIIKETTDSRHYYDSDMKLHRVNGPAIEYVDGTKKWYTHGLPDRIEGPAVQFPNGSEIWYKQGNIHREDGPAVTFENGTKEWWLLGKRHRLDGPAIEGCHEMKKWFINGVEYNEQNYNETLFTYLNPYIIGLVSKPYIEIIEALGKENNEMRNQIKELLNLNNMNNTKDDDESKVSS